MILDGMRVTVRAPGVRAYVAPPSGGLVVREAPHVTIAGRAPITATEDAEGVTLTLAEGSTITATEDAEGVTLITA